MLMLAACTPSTDPPPDVDTGGTLTAESGEPPQDPEVVNDGDGRGFLRRMSWGLLRATAIGTPLREVDGNVAAGHVSLVADFGELFGLRLPPDRTSTLVEDASYGECAREHSWAYFLGANREFGSALSFFSSEIGGDQSDYQNALVTSAPLAGNTESGRVM